MYFACIIPKNDREYMEYPYPTQAEDICITYKDVSAPQETKVKYMITSCRDEIDHELQRRLQDRPLSGQPF